MTIPSSEFHGVGVKPGHCLQPQILQEYFLMITLLHKPHPLLVQCSMIQELITPIITPSSSLQTRKLGLRKIKGGRART